MKKKIYRWDNIVVGGTVEAILYAYINNCYLLYNRIKPLSTFDFLNPKYDLSFCGLKNESKILKGVSHLYKEENLTIGLHKSELINAIMPLMSLNGKIPFAENLVSMTYTLDGNLRIVGNRGKYLNVSFDNLYIFEPSMLKNFPLEAPTLFSDDYLVEDEFSFEGEFLHDFININSGFPNYIHNMGDHLLAISRLNHEELQDFDFGEFMSQFVVNEYLAEYCQKQPLETKIVAIHTQRRVESVGPIKYVDKPNIFYKTDSLDEIMEMDDKQSEYCIFLRDELWNTEKIK